MQPNADLARTLCATTGDSAEPRFTEAAGVAVCRQTGKQMPEPAEIDVRNWTNNTVVMQRWKTFRQLDCENE